MFTHLILICVGLYSIYHLEPELNKNYLRVFWQVTLGPTQFIVSLEVLIISILSLEEAAAATLQI